MISTAQFHMCDVCRLLDGDITEKLCGYCSLCDAFICEADANRWDRRLQAAIKRQLEPGAKVQSGYVESLQGEQRQ